MFKKKSRHVLQGGQVLRNETFIDANFGNRLRVFK